MEEGFLKLPREMEIGSKNQRQYIRKIKGGIESHLFLKQNQEGRRQQRPYFQTKPTCCVN